MGIFKQGILGGFRNKVGTVIGSKWRGKNVMRGLPDIDEDRVPTQKQMDQRVKFGLITSLLAWVSEIVAIGYRSVIKGATPMNEAVSDNFALAITGTSPNFGVDPAKLCFSKGKLGLPGDNSVSAAVDAVLDFAWSKDIEGKYNHLTDSVHLIVYNPDKQNFVTLANAAMRGAEAYSLQLPLNWTDDTVHSYMCLSEPAEYGKACSNTLYLGQLTVL